MRTGLALLAASLVAFGGCSGGGGAGDTTPPVDPPCGPLGECTGGRVCDPLTDTCVAPDAYDWCALANCPDGQVCDLSTETGCRPATSCAEVTCATGLHCDWYDYHCTATPRCTLADECPAGHFCDAHRLCVEPGPGQCLDDGGCQAGYVCDLATHLCRGQAVCADQSACEPGWTCRVNRCELLAPGTCDAANDCGAGAACQAGICVGCGTEGTVCTGNFESCDAAANRCVACTTSCALPGDACSAPAPLTLAEGRNVLSVDLHGYGCDGADCAAGLADAWWSFTLTTNAMVELGVAAEAYGAAAPRVELRAAGCGARIAGHVFTDGADRQAMELPAGTYALRLVGEAAVATPHALFVTRTSQAASGMSCGNPAVFSLDTAGAGQRAISFSSGAHHVSGDACDTGAWGGGAVLALDLAARSWVEVTLDPATNNPYPLGIEVKDACLPEVPYACYAAPGAHGVVTARGAGPGRQYVVVHGDGTDLFYSTVYVVTKPWPANDRCSSATPMPAFVNDGWPKVSSTVSGSTADDSSLPDAALQCGGTTYGGNDQFFTFSTVADESLAVTVTPDAPGTWTPVVAIETACGEAAGLQCAVGGAGTPAIFTRDLLDPGQYVVHVMSGSGPGGPFTAKVTLGNPIYPARPNASCTAPDAPEVIALAGVGDSVTTASDTRGGGGWGVAICGWDSLVGDSAPALVYQVVLPASAPRGRVRLTAAPLRASFDPALTAQGTCGDVAADLGCWNSSGPGVAEVGSLSVNGSAFVWVKGAGAEDPYAFEGTSGPFELTATYEAAAPPNDVCADAATSTLSMATVATPASVTGDLSAATPTSGACGGGLVDAFHVVTVVGGSGQAQPVNVTLTPSGFTGRLRIYLNDCSSCLASTVTGTGVGAPVVLPITSMRAGDVRTIGVSSADGNVGTYTLTAGPP